MKIPIVFLPLLILLSYSAVHCVNNINNVVLGPCSYSSDPDTAITHITWYLVNNAGGKITAMSRCKNNGGTDPFRSCKTQGTIPALIPANQHLTLLISVTQKKARLVNDVEYRYIPSVMKMSAIADPRTMYSSNNRFNDNGLLNIREIRVGGNILNMCDSSRVALGIAEHGLYVIEFKTKIHNDNRHFQKAYFEPRQSGEFFIYGQ